MAHWRTGWISDFHLGMKGTRAGVRLDFLREHDGFVTGYLGTYGSVTLQKHAIHTTVDGKRILVFHGHELDALVQNLGWLGHAGDLGYTVLLRSNDAVNLARRLLGLDPWSLSAYVKGRVRNVAKFIG